MRRGFEICVKVIFKPACGEIAFPLTKKFSNMTDFVAIITSSLRKIFGHESPFKIRIIRCTFSKNTGHCN